MKKTRTQYAILNTTISGVIFIINTLLRFVSRSVFVYFLGKTYLGINSLFTSIIGMLSLSELGIGSAIVYSLYQPLSDNDYIKTKSLLVLYKKIYAIIGIIVMGIGLLIIPFIPRLTNYVEIPHLYLIYILFLINSVISYFFSYNRSLLNADQKNYLILINDFIFSVIMIIGQMLILWRTKNFILYLLVAILFTILGNFVLKKKVDKEYIVLKDLQPQPLDKETKDILKKNTIGNLASKIGKVIVFTTDNIYISLFAGIKTVGIYNNYMIVINSANSLISQMLSALTGTLGNLAVTSNGEKGYQIYKRNHFINYIITSIFAVSFTYLLNDFIKLWVGDSYVLPMETIFLIIVNYILFTYRNVTLTFITAYGLSWHLRWKVFFECLCNVLFSAFFLVILHLGLNGVILGTIFSTLLVVEWWEPYTLFKYGLKVPMKRFWKIVLRQVFVLLFTICFVGMIISKITVIGWTSLILKALLIILLTIISISINYLKSDELNYLFNMFKKFICKFI